MVGLGKFILFLNLENLLSTRSYLLRYCHNTVKYSSDQILSIKPKKPENSFLLYVKSIKSKLVEDYPTITVKEIVKKAAEEWAILQPTQKEKYQMEYKTSYATYLNKLQEFHDNLTADEKMILNNLKYKKDITLKKSENKLKEEAFGKPKRPLNAFFIYLNERKKGMGKIGNSKDVTRQLKLQWLDMDNVMKAEYKDRAKKSMATYADTLFIWEQHMVNLGHNDIVRRKTLRILGKGSK